MNRWHEHATKRDKHDLLVLVKKVRILLIELHLLGKLWIKERSSRHCGVKGSLVAGHLDSISEPFNSKSKDHSRSSFLNPAIAEIRMHV